MASSYHSKFKDFLINDMLIAESSIKEEYPVKDLNPNWHTYRHRFDFYIPSWNLVVEIHGEQHYNPATFGGVSKSQAEAKYIRQVTSDVDKAYFANCAGCCYLAYSYKDVKNITSDSFYQDYLSSKKELPPLEEVEKNLDKKSSFKSNSNWVKSDTPSFKGSNGFTGKSSFKSSGFRKPNNKV